MKLIKFLTDRNKTYGFLGGLRMAVAYARESCAGKGTFLRIRPPGAVHPVKLRARTSDIEVFEQIFGRREMEFPLIAEPKIIVDAGANIGLASIALALRYPRAKIFALELDESNHRMLVENIKSYPAITAIHCALWSHSTHLKIENPGADSWAFRGAEAPDPSVGVEAVGLSDLMARFSLDRIDLLKLDIEGGELEVLGKNIEPWINRVGAMAVELHEQWVPGCNAAFEKVRSRRPGRVAKFGEYNVIEFDPFI
jgi:FkbM family methyltransferase